MADTLRETATITKVINPLTLFPWKVAYWAEDPAQTWPADGANVNTWRNAGSASGMDLTYSSLPGAYALSGINGKPALRFTRTPYRNYVSSIAAPRVDPPAAVVMVFQPTNPDAALGNQGIWYCPWYNGGNNYLRTLGNGVFQFLGWSTTPTAPSSPPYQNQTLVVAQTRTSGVYDLRMYGTNTTAGVVNAGGSGWGGFSNLFLGSSSSYTKCMEGLIAFYGVYAGDITTHGNYETLLNWAQNYYGLRSVI